jgi:hypothetical protein
MVNVSTEHTRHMDTVGNRQQRGSVVDFNASVCPTFCCFFLLRARSCMSICPLEWHISIYWPA